MSTVLICSVTALEGKANPAAPVGDHGVARGHAGSVLCEWDDHRQLGELVDTVVGQDDHGPCLLDLDPNVGIDWRTGHGMIDRPAALPLHWGRRSSSMAKRDVVLTYEDYA